MENIGHTYGVPKSSTKKHTKSTILLVSQWLFFFIAFFACIGLGLFPSSITNTHVRPKTTKAKNQVCVEGNM